MSRLTTSSPPTVLLTGATGAMGRRALQRMLADQEDYHLLVLAQGTPRDREVLSRYRGAPGLRVLRGDLSDTGVVERCVAAADIICHLAALVPPAADKLPRLAMEVNYGSTRALLDAIHLQGRADAVRLVWIGTVAQTGDRMPPIHWGRVGDPIKPSIFDYYAVSKVAAERAVIDSGLARWVSLRQTGIMSPAMVRIVDPIMFHNPFDNALEYVSDRDSGRMLRNLVRAEVRGELPAQFWGHVYNVGGGASCRAPAHELYGRVYRDLGIRDPDLVLHPRMEATRNFHGHYYLDSNRLEGYLRFRRDSIEYFYELYRRRLGAAARVARAVCALPGGQRLVGAAVSGGLRHLARRERGTLHILEHGAQEEIDAYWGSRAAWEALPERGRDMRRFKDWDTVVPIDHGYDESAPESALDRAAVAGAARFRGGELLSQNMVTGDWRTPLRYRCAFGHEFTGSPRLILEGGHWCEVCERQSWNYGRRAQVDPFFAQVWTPLHDPQELREYPKMISELDV